MVQLKQNLHINQQKHRTERKRREAQVRSTVVAPEDHHESASQGRLRRSAEIKGEQEERCTRAMKEGEGQNRGR